MIGPPNAKPGYQVRYSSSLWRKNSAVVTSPGTLCQVPREFEFNPALVNIMEPSPWKSFVPLLVATLITPPTAPPYSASNPPLLTWTSLTNSKGIELSTPSEPRRMSETSTPSMMKTFSEPLAPSIW